MEARAKLYSDVRMRTCFIAKENTFCLLTYLLVMIYNSPPDFTPLVPFAAHPELSDRCSIRWQLIFF